jgi:hypothetical protein
MESWTRKRECILSFQIAISGVERVGFITQRSVD